MINMRPFLAFLFVVNFCLHALAQSPLAPLKLDSPRDTMHSFMQAMDDYKKGVTQGDKNLISRLDDAVQTLDTSEIPYIVRKEQGREIAKLLKEVIDRVIVINYDLIPDDPERKLPWRLKDTEIKIFRLESGEHQGEFLFSKETVQNAKEFYDKIKDLPYLPGTTKGANYVAPWNERLVPPWARGSILGLQRWQWIGLLFSVFLGLFSKFLTTTIVGGLKKVVRGSGDSRRRLIIEALERPSGLFVAALLWLLAIQLLQFEGLPMRILSFVVQVLISVSLIWAAYGLSNLVSLYLLNKAEKTKSDLNDHLVPILAKSLKVFVVVMGALVTVDNLGFDVMSLMAGLGLGGLAFALAAKDTAANLFGSIVILLDRPFKIGDLVVSGGVEGTVVGIGFRSTQIKTLYDSVVSVPNSKLATDIIDNMGMRTTRRLRTTLGVTYNTPPEKIVAFIDGIKKLLEAHPLVKKDNYIVVFHSYNSSSLDILLNCFLIVPDWATELKQREILNLDILNLAKNLGVSFAFPSQSIYVESTPSKMQ